MPGASGRYAVKERAIPKRGGKLRGWGFATVRDRVVQAALKLVLEPIFEADFQPCSYGFRPGRRAQDAIAEIHYLTSSPRSYEWIVEADIEACFDRLRPPGADGSSAAADRGQARAVADQGVPEGRDPDRARRLRGPITGTPQGGILSPLMANVALCALDEHYARAWEAMGQKWHQRDAIRRRGEATFRLVRYADDFRHLRLRGAAPRRAADRADRAGDRAARAEALAREDPHHPHRRGNRLPRLADQTPTAGKRRPLVHLHLPVQAVADGRQGEGQAITRSGPNQTLAQLLHRLNPVLRGWCAYFRCGVSSQTFAYLDAFSWRRVVCWLRRKYPKTELALADRPPPTEVAADRWHRDALPPGEGGDHSLPLPGHEDRHTMRSRLDRSPRSGLRARAPGEPDRLMAAGCLWRARRGGSRTPGSEGGSRKRAAQKRGGAP